jgi:hypothetical protein
MIDFFQKGQDSIESITLEKQGEYVSYDASEVNHSALALEDSIVLAIRWPSLRNK